MIMKVIDFHNTKTRECDDVNNEQAFHCHGVGSHCHYPMIYGDDLTGNWIMLTPQSYKIVCANFYTSQFRLILDRYISLLSQFKDQPQQLPFVKFVSTPCSEKLHNPAFGVPASIGYVTKQGASKIDSLFIRFHNH
jgi:hypothetical protein